MAVEGRSVELNISGGISAVALRTDILTSADQIKDRLDYTKFAQLFENGAEANEVEILYHNTRNFVSPSESINLDGGLVNAFGDVLDFYTIKFVVIRNNETAAGRMLLVTLHGETYYIGPGGTRIIIEPNAFGLQKNGASSEGDFGNLSLSGIDNINYDLIIAGSTATQNVSSGI